MTTAHELTKELAENHDLAFIDRGNGHLQLKTRHHLVNYWPYSHARTVWSDTAKYKEVGVTPERAIAICFELERETAE